MGSVVSSASPFATPARQALGALRDRQRAAAHAGAPFAEEAVREMERIVVRAARSAAASAKGSSACASGAATPISRTRPALPRLATAHSAAKPAPRVQALVSALEKRDVADPETVAEERVDAPEKARPSGVSGAPAPETPSPAAPTPKLPSRGGVVLRARGRASPGAPSAAMSDAGSNRARSPPREPLDESERLAEKDNERQLRSASEATDAARDRVRVAEERYRAARERLKEAFSAASRSRESSAMPTPRGGAEAAEAGVSTHVESGRNQKNETETENGTGKHPKPSALAAEVREMAEKARAAAARSRLASARAATTAELAARDADAEASRVREAWTRRLARSPRATPGDDSLGKGVGSRDAVPADRWASSDEVRGKTDVLDRFMGSLTDMRASSPPDGEAAGGGDGRDATSTSTVRSRGRGRSGAPRQRLRDARAARGFGWRPRWRRRRRRAGRGAGDDGVRGGAGAGARNPRRANGGGCDARDPAWRPVGVAPGRPARGRDADARRGRRGAAAGLRARDAAVATRRDSRGARRRFEPGDAARGSAGAARVQDHPRRAARFVHADQGGRRVRSARGGRRGGRERGGNVFGSAETRGAVAAREW